MPFSYIFIKSCETRRTGQNFLLITSLKIFHQHLVKKSPIQSSNLERGKKLEPMKIIIGIQRMFKLNIALLNKKNKLQRMWF